MTTVPDATFHALEANRYLVDCRECATDAILGVALFKEQAPNSFGRFNRAFVSMFRIAGGETWIEGLPFLDDAGDIYWKSSLFVCSYLVLNVWVVLQVPCLPTLAVDVLSAAEGAVDSVASVGGQQEHPRLMMFPADRGIRQQPQRQS
jgi:hypothetical protein